MSRRFFTSDFHLDFPILLDKSIVGADARPFKNVRKLNDALIRSCNARAKIYTHTEPMLDDHGGQCVDSHGDPLMKTIIDDRDLIIHLGDFCCTGTDRGFKGSEISPQKIIEEKINANFINVRGNHDPSNSVKWACDSLQLRLGKRYPNVTACHYPSYDTRAAECIRPGYIHLCGHVHKSWKHCLDLDHQILNINVGVDVWRFNIVPEDEIILYLDRLLKKKPNELYRCKTIVRQNGKEKLTFFGVPDKS